MPRITPLAPLHGSMRIAIWPAPPEWRSSASRILALFLFAEAAWHALERARWATRAKARSSTLGDLLCRRCEAGFSIYQRGHLNRYDAGS